MREYLQTLNPSTPQFTKLLRVREKNLKLNNTPSFEERERKRINVYDDGNRVERRRMYYDDARTREHHQHSSQRDDDEKIFAARFFFERRSFSER